MEATNLGQFVSDKVKIVGPQFYYSQLVMLADCKKSCSISITIFERGSKVVCV